MGFINKDWTLNKDVILNHFANKLEGIFYSDKIKENIVNYAKVAKFNDDYRGQDKNAYYKKNKRKLTPLLFFTEKVLQRAIKYTPIQDDESHYKRHPKEPHLKNAFKIEHINDNALRLVNRNSYAAAVHEDASARHASPTRSHFLLDAVEEVSAEYRYPFTVYIKIADDGVSIIIDNNDGYNSYNNGEHKVVDVDEETNSYGVMIQRFYYGSNYGTVKTEETGYSRLFGGRQRSKEDFYHELRNIENFERERYMEKWGWMYDDDNQEDDYPGFIDMDDLFS